MKFGWPKASAAGALLDELTRWTTSVLGHSATCGSVHAMSRSCTNSRQWMRRDYEYAHLGRAGEVSIHRRRAPVAL